MTPSFANSSLDYDRLRDSLAHAGAVVALAELHGGVCGALCAGGASAAERWLADSLDDAQLAASAVDVVRELKSLVASSAAMLADEGLAFEPLLPSDDAPLAERVNALALWCHGFLAGVGATAPGVGGERAASAADFAEIFRDFGEISRAGLSEEEESRQDGAEFSLAEIHEYVRVSVQLVYEQFASRRSAAARGRH